jgi:pyrimidine operon attenuation protein/uracil phosphoribosyltransferase
METIPQQKNYILNSEVAKRKLRRMAFEIAENNADAESLIIAGINGNGEVIAKTIIKELKQIINIPVQFLLIIINKKQVLEVAVDQKVDFNNKIVIMVDDVANTGKTMLFSLKPFLESTPKKIQTLVLVERSHKQFPAQIDYVGLSISTTLQEQIIVEVNGEQITGAYLL